jgi:hypothetical protein
MRKAMLAAVAAASSIFGLLGLMSTPAAAADATTVADLAITVTGVPDHVSPPGGTVVYKITASTAGDAPVAPVHIVDTTTGGTYRAEASQLAPGCTTTAGHNPSVTCDITLTPGAPVTFYVGIATDAVVGSATNHAHINFQPGFDVGVVDPNLGNNDASVTTPVDNSNSSATYLREGESTTFQTHKLTVRTSATGIITKLTTAPAGGAQCGTTSCKQGLRVLFYETARYSGKVGVDLNFGATYPCGSATIANCKPLYYRKTNSGAVTQMPRCATAADSLCWESIERRTVSGAPPADDDSCSSTSQWHVIVRMNTDDPDLLAPIKSLTSGTGS